MTEQTVGFALVGQYADRYEDDYEAATALLVDLKVNTKASAALKPVVAWAVGTQRRSEVRNIQRAARAPRRGLGFTADSILARKKALETMMAMGDGRRVRLGAATVEDHRAYIGMLERNVVGLQDTIRFHEELIVQIEAAGVVCLDDIEVAA